MSRETWMTTAAAAAVIGADAEVPPLRTVTESCGVQRKKSRQVCASAAMLSEGAEMLTRVPKPEEKPPDPL